MPDALAHHAGPGIALHIDGRPVRVPAGCTVAAAIAMSGCINTRRAVSGGMRAPLCGMGVCHECRVTIDGRAHQLSCQTLCAQNMRVETQGGAR